MKPTTNAVRDEGMRHVEAQLEESIVSLFGGFPSLCGFSVQDRPGLPDGGSAALQAARQSVRQLLIDVRSLLGRVGTLGTLLGPQGEMAGCRVAVLDVSDNDPYYVFSENAARMRGRELRYFYDPAAALHWLRATTAD